MSEVWRHWPFTWIADGWLWGERLEGENFRILLYVKKTAGDWEENVEVYAL